MSQALDFPLPPTTGSYGVAPPTTPPAVAEAPAPAPRRPNRRPPRWPKADEVALLRAQVAELTQVVSLAKTRVETLGAEKREALERALRLESELEAARLREAELLQKLAPQSAARAIDDSTVAELLDRVAALEAIVAPSRAA